MSTRNTVIRRIHDIGLAVWCGGALMGAIGLNGAANEVEQAQRGPVASAGWARWAPVNAAAIGVPAIGGIGLIMANKGRIAGQKGVATNTIVKAAWTGVALASTAYSGAEGKIVADAGSFPTDGAVAPSSSTPEKVAAAQRQLRVAQWVTPAVTAVLIVLGAAQGEQQRRSQVISGLLNS